MKNEYQELNNEKLACLWLLQKSLKEKNYEKSYLLALKIKNLNRMIQNSQENNQKRK